MERHGFPYDHSYGPNLINRGICRQFLNGSCRYGSSCHYLHEWPSVLPPTSQICRYFQKGVCWFGERCRYLHITNVEAAATGMNRRGSAPSVYSSWLGHAQPYRRGSEPSLTQAQRLSSHRQSDRGLETTQIPVAPSQHSHGHQNTGITEGNAEGSSQTSPQRTTIEESSHTPIADPKVSVQPCPEVSTQSVVPSGTLSAQADEWRAPVSQQQGSSSQGASARPDLQTDEADEDASSRSRDVTCGICMETVYEKTNAEDRRFGILPNCCHSFCLNCIVTWRKTRNFQEEVVKGCPQCRIKSAFYVPHKYWVEGPSKERLVRTFKEKCSKRRCSFFMRHGGCPFKTECLYWHDLPRGYRPPRPRLSANSRHAVSLDGLDSLQLLDYVIAMTLLDDLLDEDDEDEFYWGGYDEYNLI